VSLTHANSAACAPRRMPVVSLVHANQIILVSGAKAIHVHPCHAKITAYAHRLAPIVSLVRAQMGTLETNVRIKNAILPARLVTLAGILVALITLLYFFEVAGIKK